MNLDASTADSIQLDLLIHDFFEAENLTLPKNANWRTVKANIFEVVDGKKILFETNEALFHRIRNKANLIVDRATVAGNMKPDELHNDIHRLFDHLESLVNTQ